MIKIIKGRNQSGSGLHISVIAKVSPWALIVLVETPPRAQVSPGRPEMLTYLLMWGESKMDMAKRFRSHRGKYAMITKTDWKV